MIKNILLCTTLIFTFSCSTLKDMVEPPKVKLEDVKVGQMTLTGMELEIILAVQNPNNIDFDVKSLTYILDINGKQVTTGKMQENVLVKAKQKTSVTVPLMVSYSELISSALLLLKQEGMPYRVKGSIEIGPFTIPFDDKGNLKAADL